MKGDENGKRGTASLAAATTTGQIRTQVAEPKVDDENLKRTEYRGRHSLH